MWIQDGGATSSAPSLARGRKGGPAGRSQAAAAGSDWLVSLQLMPLPSLQASSARLMAGGDGEEKYNDNRKGDVETAHITHAHTMYFCMCVCVCMYAC